MGLVRVSGGIALNLVVVASQKSSLRKSFRIVVMQWVVSVRLAASPAMSTWWASQQSSLGRVSASSGLALRKAR